MKLAAIAIAVIALLFASQGGWIGMLTAGAVYTLGRAHGRTPTQEESC